MIIVGIDSSSIVASVAIIKDDDLIAEYTVNYKKTHSQTLLPMLDQVCKMSDLDINDIDAIAVAAGPGSFTGLRIGSATAKGIGLATGKPVVAVPTIEAMAYNCILSDDVICPLMDARRDQVYTGLFSFSKVTTDGMSRKLETMLASCAISIEELVEAVNATGKRVLFLGDGVPVHKQYLEEHIKVDYMYVPLNLDRQRASSVALLGKVKYEAGEYESAAEHAPVYYRMSQAERERMEKDKLDAK